MMTRRGPADLAGRKCAHKNEGRGTNSPKTDVCKLYARYAVSFRTDDNVLHVFAGTCGQHLSDEIRSVWDTYKTAAVIQEIPGMWRDK